MTGLRSLETSSSTHSHWRDGLPTLGPPDPVSAPDCYFTGFLHLFFSLVDEDYVARARSLLADAGLAHELRPDAR